MKLYRLVNGLGDYWVIANDPTEAENKLKEVLDAGDYGFSSKRIVKEIHLVAEEITKDKSSYNLTNRFLLI
jgi:hypothetical protein